ncbi:MAG: hypothetical protein FWE43_04595, partial [Streptococcaceae bacterium]|nr:hypothetical protein [Streptococcaceae bacterium]MCL2681749.1 hypothetical protein [Streptococcaceae bacterium]
NAKTGLFTTDGIDMKIVSSLDDTYNNFEGYKTLAKDLGISESEAIALCKKYKVSPNDDVVLTNEDDGTISMANKTTGQDYTGFMNRFLSWLQTTNDAPQENQEPPIAGLPSTQDDLDKYVKKHTAEATKDAAESGKPAEYQVDGEAGAELSGFGALVQWANIRNKHVPQKTIKGTDYVIMEEEMDKEAQKEKAIQDQIDKATNPANNWSQTEGIGYGGNVHR